MEKRSISEPQIPEMLEHIRQNSVVQVEPFVLEFLNIWYEIHQKVAEATLEDALSLSQSILKEFVLPFYEKHKGSGNLDLYKGWIDSYASLYLKWGERGGFLFPLKLIIYEITHHRKGLFFTLLNRVQTEQICRTKADLFEEIFPLLSNFVCPLDEIDINLLKGYQVLQPLKSLLYKSPENTAFAELLKVSTRTIVRRLKIHRLLQTVNSNLFIDMGKLGYETIVIFHTKPFPSELHKYLLLSSRMSIGTFSVVQIPANQIDVQMKLQEELEPLLYEPMEARTTSWNLGGLSAGEDLWTTPPSFFYTNTKPTTPTPDLHFPLDPTFDSFRKLSRADFRILDFLVREGNFRSLSEFSKAIKVNRMEISHRLREYAENDLFLKAYQYFNIGLDLTVFFFISDTNSGIPWLPHFLTFPKIDVFYQQKETPNYYFGYLKLPPKWIKPFARKVDLLSEKSDIKFYHKIFTSIDQFKWGISLADTYYHH